MTHVTTPHQDSGLEGPRLRGDIESFAQAMMADPVQAFGISAARMHALDRLALEKIQLFALKSRIAQLRDRIPMLQKLADEVGIKDLASLQAVVPLLFRHTVYKSYPPSLLEKSQFRDLTRWLSKLTTVDLSSIDVSQCRTIDEWIDVLDAETPLSLMHSSGTSGTMSLIPRTKAEAQKHFLAAMLGLFQDAGVDPPLRTAPKEMHVLHGNFRRGASSHLRTAQQLLNYLCNGNEEKLHSLYPHRQSADIMYLAGRMSAAAAKGELDRLELTPAMLARKAEFETMQRKMPADQEAFFSDMITNLRGAQIYMMGTWNIHYKLAAAGAAKGLQGVFSPQSILVTGGGAKGQAVPEGWEEVVKTFFGVSRLSHVYGMTEVMAMHRRCDYGHYHIEPWIIPFLLDPESGEPFPRGGMQTGRAAFFDLMADTYWGGFVTGDQITLNWDGDCSCGRRSVFVVGDISRYSDQRGGDDKISCAAAPEAHENALKYLTDIMG